MGNCLPRRAAQIAAVLAACIAGVAQQPEKTTDAERRQYFLANYTKYEYRIPMRDGVRLFTNVYVPKDDSRTYPILLRRTPYTVAPYGVDRYTSIPSTMEKFVKEGFIFADQDVRGRTRSEGEFVNVRPYVPNKSGPKDVDETTDTYDSIEWMVKNVRGNSGRVGMWGISYPGFYAAMGLIDAHPALKASSPQAPIADWFIGDDWRHNGALFLAHTFGFFTFFGRPWSEPGQTPRPEGFRPGTPDGYDFFMRLGPLRNIDLSLFGTQAAFWKELMEHDRYDAFWQARNIRPHLKNVKPAVLTVGGWFDAEDVLGPLGVYQAIESQSPTTVNVLVEGPWSHGGWMGDTGESLGNARFLSKTAEFYRDNIFFPFFLHHLKGKDDPGLPEAYVFETGRNQWRKHEAWPPRSAAPRAYYLQAGGRLGGEAPADQAAFDEYISDPNKPVPFTDEISSDMTYNYMVSDQRFAARRTDVLVYATDPLDSDITLAGPIECELHVSTTGTDSDFVVKLIDAFPDNYPDPDPNPREVRMGGYQQLVRGEPFRGRFRNSFEKPEAFEPGRTAKVAFKMPDVFHTFRSGHRLMIHVQSSWFPLVDRNPQTFVPIHQAAGSDFQKATQRVHRSRSAASMFRVRVLP